MKNIFISMIVTTMAIAGAVAGVVGVVSAKSQTAQAAASSCQVTFVDATNNRAIKVEGRTAKATVVVTGTNANCNEYATLAVWKMPNSTGHPLSAQKFYGHTTKKLTVGTHTISAELPLCHWQADLLAQKRPKSIHGDANYDAMGKDALVNYRMGGNRSCDQTPPSKDKCPIPGMENLPKDDPDCKVTPEAPQTPGTPSTPVTPGAALPETGAGAMAVIGSSLAAVGSGIAHYIYRRKSL